MYVSDVFECVELIQAQEREQFNLRQTEQYTQAVYIAKAIFGKLDKPIQLNDKTENDTDGMDRLVRFAKRIKEKF